MSLPVRPPIAPMLARLARELPGGTWLYEPKWDGFRTIAFRDGDAVDLRSRHDRPLARYFPEIVDALRAVQARSFVVDGELVLARDGRLDFAALMARLHPARSRAARLAADTPATLIAFDLVAIGDADLRDRPFRERRARLETLLAGSAVAVTPATADRRIALDWLARFHGNGIDGVVAKDPSASYQPGRRAMVKVKREQTADCVVAGYRLLGDPTLLGSLLLGLYDARGNLVHVGVASQFSDADRRTLAAALAKIVAPIAGHPWEGGFGLERSPLGRLHGAAGRWSPAEMERDWIPVRPELVCEVAYDTVDDRRFRHPARFRRWRPARTARSCALAQLTTSSGDVPALLSA